MRLLARPLLVQLIRNKSTTAYTCRYDFDTLSVTSPSESVLHVELNRPEKQNQLNKTMFRELHECFSQINDDQDARVVILSGKGKEFSTGMDWDDMMHYIKRISERKIDCTGGSCEPTDVARTAKLIRSTLIQFQESFTAIENCSKPVIATIHGACSGAALALFSVTDIRYCARNAHFQANEVNNGMCADLGTIQRLTKISTDSFAREMIYTAEKVTADTAQQVGLVSRVFENENDSIQAAIETGQRIASKSPVAVQGSKILLKYSRDHSVSDGLRMTANWNMAMLQSQDVVHAMQAQQDNKEPTFSNL